MSQRFASGSCAHSLVDVYMYLYIFKTFFRTTICWNITDYALKNVHVSIGCVCRIGCSGCRLLQHHWMQQQDLGMSPSSVVPNSEHTIRGRPMFRNVQFTQLSMTDIYLRRKLSRCYRGCLRIFERQMFCRRTPPT